MGDTGVGEGVRERIGLPASGLGERTEAVGSVESVSVARSGVTDEIDGQRGLPVLGCTIATVHRLP